MNGQHDTPSADVRRSPLRWILPLAAIAIIAAVFLRPQVPTERRDPFDLSNGMLAVTDTNYGEVIAGSSVVFLEFSASWCGPCHLQAPIVHRLAEEYAGRVTFGVVNADSNETRDTSARHNAHYLPHVVILREGVAAGSLTGLQTESALRTAIETALAQP